MTQRDDARRAAAAAAWSRREFLRRAGVGTLGLWAGGSLLAACGGGEGGGGYGEAAAGSDTGTAAAGAGGSEASGSVVWHTTEHVSREDYIEDAGFTDVTVERSLYIDEPAMIQQLQAGAVRADVIDVSIAGIPRLLELDLVQPMDEAAISNWSDLYGVFRELPASRDGDGGLVWVPYYWGTDAVAYNAAEVPAGQAGSWGAIFDDAFAGRTCMRNDAQEGLAVVGILLGAAEPFNMTDDELAEALDFLKAHKQNVRLLWTEPGEAADAFRNGDIVLGHSWEFIIYELQAEGHDVQWALPQEGAISFVQGQALSKTSESTAGAAALIDWLIGPEYQVPRGVEQNQTMCSTALIEELGDEAEERGILEEQVTETISNAFMFETTRDIERYQEVWSEFLSS